MSYCVWKWVNKHWFTLIGLKLIIDPWLTLILLLMVSTRSNVNLLLNDAWFVRVQSLYMTTTTNLPKMGSEVWGGQRLSDTTVCRFLFSQVWQDRLTLKSNFRTRPMIHFKLYGVFYAVRSKNFTKLPDFF